MFTFDDIAIWEAGYEMAHRTYPAERPAHSSPGSLADDLCIAALESRRLRKLNASSCASTDPACVTFIDGARTYLDGIPVAPSPFGD